MRNPFLPFSALLLLLVSCNSYIFVNKTYDPEIRVSNDPERILFINRFDYTNPVFVKERQSITYRAGVKEFITGIVSEFSKDSSFTLIIGDTLRRDAGLNQLTALMPGDTIRTLCSRYMAGYLMTFDSLSIGFTNRTEETEDGKEKFFDIYGLFYISFYNADGILINRSEIRQSSFYTSRPTLTSLITIQPSIARARETFRPLAFRAGEEYVGRFYPKTVPETRVLYGGKEFEQSNLYIQLKNWKKAAELLEKLQYSSNPRIAKKAIHNLEVVREAAALD